MLDLDPPVQIMFLVKFPKSTRVADPANFVKVSQDAIADGLGFDDDMTRIVSGPFLGIKTKEKQGEFIFIIREVDSLFDCFSVDESLINEFKNDIGSDSI